MLFVPEQVSFLYEIDILFLYCDIKSAQIVVRYRLLQTYIKKFTIQDI